MNVRGPFNCLALLNTDIADGIAISGFIFPRNISAAVLLRGHHPLAPSASCPRVYCVRRACLHYHISLSPRRGVGGRPFCVALNGTRQFQDRNRCVTDFGALCPENKQQRHRASASTTKTTTTTTTRNHFIVHTRLRDDYKGITWGLWGGRNNGFAIATNDVMILISIGHT